MSTNPIPFAEVCTRLHRAPVYVRGLQRRFALPLLDGASYTAAYVAFLETIIHLRILGVPEETLTQLWHLERKLMDLLHADAIGSLTWFLDACGAADNRGQRLLLSNFDLGVYLPSGSLQLGLNFSSKTTPELFTAPEMGEDAILVLRQYVTLHQEILRDILMEYPIVGAALRQFPPLRRPVPKRWGTAPRAKPEDGSFIPGEI